MALPWLPMAEQRPTYPFDHHAPGFADDPWSVYRTLRDGCPVAWSDRHGGFWVVSRYEDVSRIARDDVTFSSAREVVLPRTGVGRLLPLNSDPPDLLRYRKALQRFFTVGSAEALAPEIRRYTTVCIDSFIERGEADMVLDVANPVPAMTTLHMLGLPIDDWRSCVEPVHAVSFHRAGDPAQEEAQRQVAGMRSRLAAIIEAEGTSFGPDSVIGHLLGVEAGGTIDHEELIDLVAMVVFGGLDTTTASLGNALMYLHEHPEAARRLREDPSLLPRAIDELLRHEAPVQGFARTVTQACVLGDQRIAKGETVFMLWASANRDPEVFADPDAVILERDPNRHLTFGIGGHRCLGATLARVEMRVMLEEIVRRLPDLEVVKASRPDTVGVVYGFARMAVRFTPGPIEGPADRSVYGL
ncbi:cytochrome P450 [soil metagenome]